MVDVRCCAVVYEDEMITLVRPLDAKPGARWRLPEYHLQDGEDPVDAIRRVVLAQTGRQSTRIRLFRILCEPKTSRQTGHMRFIFGCEVSAPPVQPPTREAASFDLDTIIQMGQKEEVQDDFLLRMISRYKDELFSLRVTPTPL